MKVSEIINQLQSILDKDGDIPVLIRIYDIETDDKRKRIPKDTDFYHGISRVFVDKDINKYLGGNSSIAVIE